eukprot:1993167-Rhodomonas_salina.10
MHPLPHVRYTDSAYRAPPGASTAGSIPPSAFWFSLAVSLVLTSGMLLPGAGTGGDAKAVPRRQAACPPLLQPVLHFPRHVVRLSCCGDSHTGNAVLEALPPFTAASRAFLEALTAEMAARGRDQEANRGRNRSPRVPAGPSQYHTTPTKKQQQHDNAVAKAVSRNNNNNKKKHDTKA